MAITLDGSTNNIAIGANTTGSAYVRLYEDTDNGTNYVDIIAPASITSNRTLTLPDTTGTILNDQSSIESQVKTATNSSGSAPIYAARAWVNFNGTGTVAIRASGNVSSITDNGTGDYTVNFTTAMADANYNSVAMGRHYSGVSDAGFIVCFQNGATDGTTGRLAGSLRVSSHQSNTTMVDSPCVTVTIFR